MKVVLAGLLLSLSGLATASPERCNFENVKGELFEFASPSPVTVRADVMVKMPKHLYPNWFNELNGNSQISSVEYFGRQGKLQTSKPVKISTENTLSDKFNSTNVRYYSAIADNCKQVYLRVDESDFPEYFSADREFSPMVFDFLQQERWAGITLLDNFGDLQRQRVDTLTVLPEGNGEVVFINELGTDATRLSRYESVKVLDAEMKPLVLFGNFLSNYKIRVSYQGEEGYINGDYRFVTNGNPLLSVRPEYMNTVASGHLAFGMSKDEVLLSFGLPESAHSINVYNTDEGYVTDFNGKYANRGLEKVGEISYWKYAGIEHTLVFGFTGHLDEERQRFTRFDPTGLPPFMDDIK